MLAMWHEQGETKPIKCLNAKFDLEAHQLAKL